MSAGGGKSRTTIVNSTPPPTANELEAQRLQLDELRRSNALAEQMQPFLQQQIEQMQRQIDVQGRFDQLVTPEMQAQQQLEEFQRNQRTGATQEQLLQIQLEAARQGTKATPEQLAAINQATAAAQSQGESDIGRFLQQTLRQINEEAAQAAGLRATDAPALRLSERAGEEAARQQGQLTSTLQGAAANATLNFPLAQQQLTAGIASQAQSLAQGATQFQQQLQQQAMQNRNQLAQSPFAGSLSLGFTGQGLQDRMANSSSKNSSRNSSWGLSGSELAGGLKGIGSVMSMSDIRLKEDIIPIGRLKSGINIYSFRYIGDEHRNIGVMAQEVRPVIPEAVHEDASGYLMVNYSLLR